MGLISLAIRNLLRNKRRSLATLLALAIGSVSILLFGGYSTNIRYSMLTAYIRNGGHLQVQHRDFFSFGSGNPASYGIAGYQKLILSFQHDPELNKLIEVVSPTLAFGGIAGNYDAGASRTVVGLGYEAKDVNRMRTWNQYELRLPSRNFDLENSPIDSSILGVGVARVLLLCEQLKLKDCPTPERDIPARSTPQIAPDIADLAKLAKADSESRLERTIVGQARIELLASSGRGSPNVTALSVIGAENQGFKELDEVAVFLHLGTAQKLVYGKSEPRATAIMIQLKDTALISNARARMQAIIARAGLTQPLAIRDYEELNPFFVQTIQLFEMIFGFIFILIGSIVVFTVGNTMNAAVVERTAEIGTLRAIGLRQRGLRNLFVLEGLILGCSGAVLGVLCALLLSGFINFLQLTWLPPGSSDPLPLSIVIWGENRMICGTAIGMIFVSTASAWWPAWRAARLKIVDALRHA